MHNENQLCVSLEERLAILPKKCSGVLRGLYSLKHIDEFTLKSILDAGDLSNDRSRLFAFATSFIFMRSQSIPVSDVIAMSKAQNRRVNLWWSPKRWSEQHDRLARFETLEKLHKENMQYEMSYFESRLPEDYSGYLIKSSRRLGMEGLRQRHCVASWHTRLLHGDNAICAVFINKVRWTVELIKRDSSESPIRIGQIKSRFNRSPCPDIRSQIYKALDIEENFVSSVSSMRGYSARTWKDNLGLLMPVFEQLGIDDIEVNFYGGGDSGSIEDVNLDDDHKNHIVEVVSYQRSWEDGGWQGQMQTKETTLYEAVCDLVYDYLEETNVDWYNNDGGRGSLSIDVNERFLEANIDCFYTESSTEHSAEIDLDELLS